VRFGSIVGKAEAGVPWNWELRDHTGGYGANHRGENLAGYDSPEEELLESEDEHARTSNESSEGLRGCRRFAVTGDW